MSGARLVGLEGEVKGHEFALTRPEATIGRQVDCDLVVNDSQVSRHHARIRLVSGAYQIEDAGSTHGTWVNEARLTRPQPLADRDIIRVGSAKFGFRASVQTPVMPGLMTMVEDVGREPSAFDSARADAVAETFIPGVSPPPPGPPIRSAPVARAREAGPAGPPAIAPQPAPQPINVVRDELAEFERSLSPFMRRLEALSVSVGALSSQLTQNHAASSQAPVLPDSLRRLSDELEAEGGAARYRGVQRLLEELRSAPSDVRLLLRVSDELPAIIRLVDVYLRALDVVRAMEQP